MRLIRDWRSAAITGAVVAVGNFDGVHRGHQAVIGEAARRARAVGAPAGVLTFEPHPRRFFKPDIAPFHLTRLPAKLRLFADLGIDVVYALRFNAALARLSAEAFVDQVLIGGLALKGVVVGYDFVFGRGRGGTPEGLRDRLAGAGIAATIMPPVARVALADDEGEIYSSTGARQALAAGDLKAVSTILGRPFEIEAHVRRGDQRGRTIGFPTANLDLDHYARPRFGVYAVRARPRGANQDHAGVANLGVRPTVGGTVERLEVHLFDFAGDLYGKSLRVTFEHFIRPEMKFAGLDALKAQIAADAAEARRLLMC